MRQQNSLFLDRPGLINGREALADTAFTLGSSAALAYN